MMRTTIALLSLCAASFGGDLEEAMLRKSQRDRENAAIADVAKTRAEVLQAVQDVGHSIDALTSRVDAMESRGVQFAAGVLNRLDKPSPAVPMPQSPAVEPPSPAGVHTTVCQCLGYREHLCLCLKAGQKCHCTRTSGSVWAVNADGSKTKTTAKADPTKAAEPPAPKVEAKTDGGYLVTINGDWMYWTVNGVQWNNQGVGTGYSTYGPWTYRDGRMYESMAVQLPSQQPARRGHYETRCHGSWCERVWVSE